MAYCYECGEQVAENDVFCPFCGISLSPIAVAGDEEEDFYSKTIVTTQPATEMPFKSADAENQLAGQLDQVSETPDSPVSNFDEKTDFGSLNNKSDDFPADSAPEISAENKPDDRSSDLDIPAPKILETLRPINEISECSTLAKSVETDESSSEFSETESADTTGIEPAFVSTEGEAIENESSEIDSSPDVQAEPSLNSSEETGTGKTAEPEMPVEREIPDIDNAGLPASNDFDANNVDLQEETEKPQNLNSGQEPIAFDPARSALAVEVPIAMPEAALPVEENRPPSRFDSVSIMEKSSSAIDDTLQKSEAESFGAEKMLEPPKEPRSFTTPNMGTGGDTDGKNKTKLKPLDEGTVLNGRYEIIRKIGGGGMGAVYLASDKNLGGVLRAVKEMVQSYIEEEQQEKAVSDFKRESMLLTSLDHQSIPTIFDYFFDETEARFYLVMKYISGGDLAGRIRSAPEGRIDETSVTSWAIQIADVLDYLHNRQPPIVYRDLKPSNIMVDGNSGRVMLIDFGIARWVNKEEKGVTAVGTMGYAPPELFSGNVEARSDIYSLGSTMFHLLTGADPQSNPLLIFDFQKHPRPRQINPQLSDQIERILMRAVEYNADKRFASAAEMRKALEEHLDNLKSGRATFGVKAAPVSVALSDQPVFCGFCGQKIVATDMFCAFCGAKQPLAQQGVHSHSEGYAPAPLTAQLFIIGTNELEQPAFRLEKDDNLVGRRDPMSNIFPEIDLSKFDPQTKISRRHARIWREGSEFMVEDLGSSNGTYILPVISDSMRLQPHQPQLLTNGDKIRLGDTTLHFVLG